MTPTKTEYYDSLETLPLYNWDKWITSKNDNWFIVGYDNRQKVIESQELKELAAKLEDEYFTLLDDISFAILILFRTFFN